MPFKRQLTTGFNLQRKILETSLKIRAHVLIGRWLTGHQIRYRQGDMGRGNQVIRQRTCPDKRMGLYLGESVPSVKWTAGGVGIGCLQKADYFPGFLPDQSVGDGS